MKNYLILFTAILYASTGSITGVVIDVDNHQPLVGANVIIDGSDIGAACGYNGEFQINNISVGSYTVTVSMIGYSAVSRANVNIYSNRQTPLKFYLNPSIIKGQEVIVKSGYFEKAKDGIVSTQTIDREEIRSDPVGSYDVQRMVNSLPSVIAATDQNNEIIVRGGGPGENLFLMDHIEIPNPNHFGEVGTGGGSVNILNTEFVERIDFFAGGFSARYGDKQSSVMNIHLRDGSYDQYELDLEMSMAGLGFLMEGPWFNGKGSYISSYRKSFLKYIIKSTGLISLPEYWNSQHKITYNLNNKNKLMFNLVGGSDEINVEDENRPELRGAENVKYKGYQYTAGITLKSLFSLKGYSLFSIGKTLNSWDAHVYKNENGIIDTFFERDNIESDNFVKWDIVYKYASNLEFSTGVNIKYGQYEIREVLDSDTLFTYEYLNPNVEIDILNNYINYYDLIIDFPDYAIILDSVNQSDSGYINTGFVNNSSGGLWKYAGYTQIKYNWKSLTFTSGFRYDNVPFNNTSKLSPRFGLTFSLSPITKLNGAFGQYYQTPAYRMFMHPQNKIPLEHSYTNQVVMGVEHLFADDIKLTIELYNKSYYNRPVQQSEITIDPLDSRLGFVDIGEGKSNGIEFFLQKKFASKWYGTMSYAYSKSESQDYRDGRIGSYPWDFDSQNGFTLVGGYKFKFRESKWYQGLRESAIFPFISWIPFMVSDQLELSFRYQYSDGLPYTPQRYDFIHRKWYLDPEGELNSFRYDYYSRLDIMLLRRFNFKHINLTTFLDLQNVFNRDNEWERVYLDDGTYEMSYQYKQIPVMGIIIEF